MLDIKFIRENPDVVKDAAKKKAMKVDIDRILELDKKRRDMLHGVERLRAQQNMASEEISGQKDGDMKEKLIKEMQGVKSDLHEKESALEKIEKELNDLLKQVPNIPFEEVPVGPDESANVVIREWKPKDLSRGSEAPLRDYMEIAKAHDWIDTERAAKISGTRFGYIKGNLALLEFAIVRYALDLLTDQKKIKEVIKEYRLEISDKPFMLILPPVLIKPEYMDAMGFLHGEAADDVYYLEKDNLYLVGTSEQSIGPMHAGEVLKEEDLPVRYVGFSTCFRREAGSYGKDTKGILRVHQFDKVEMVVFSHPDKSRDEHKLLLSLNEKMMQGLGLPYRVVHISTGDMGLAKANMFDIETWVPSENTYRETHSASNTTDFQARRLNIKYKSEARNSKSETRYVHMLNDTVFAIGRTLIAIIENYQTNNGEVEVPKVLQSYIGKKKL